VTWNHILSLAGICFAKFKKRTLSSFKYAMLVRIHALDASFLKINLSILVAGGMLNMRSLLLIMRTLQKKKLFSSMKSCMLSEHSSSGTLPLKDSMLHMKSKSTQMQKEGLLSYIFFLSPSSLPVYAIKMFSLFTSLIIWFGNMHRI
jgi:hypothetical protein